MIHIGVTGIIYIIIL